MSRFHLWWLPTAACTIPQSALRWVKIPAMARKARPSQTTSKAGPGAIFLTVFAVVWNTLVVKLVVPGSDIPFWFKAIFVLAGLAVAWGALFSWRQRYRGGGARLQLAQDPVPHGVPVAVAFQLARHVDADSWQVETKISASNRDHSTFGTLWVQDYPAHCTDGYRARAEVTLPSDFPSTAASNSDTQYRVTLTLKARGIAWAFELQTRSASGGESLAVPLRGAKALGTLKPQHSAVQQAAARRRGTWFLFGFIALCLCMQLCFLMDWL